VCDQCSVHKQVVRENISVSQCVTSAVYINKSSGRTYWYLGLWPARFLAARCSAVARTDKTQTTAGFHGMCWQPTELHVISTPIRHVSTVTITPLTDTLHDLYVHNKCLAISCQRHTNSHCIVLHWWNQSLRHFTNRTTITTTNGNFWTLFLPSTLVISLWFRSSELSAFILHNKWHQLTLLSKHIVSWSQSKQSTHS